MAFQTMTETGSGSETETKYLGIGDIEAGSCNAHVTNIERKTSPSESILENMEHGESSERHTDNVDQWAISLSCILEDVPHYMCSPGHPGRIGRIPKNLREVDLKAYEPCLMSLGPYHHGKSKLQSMENTKWLFLKLVLENRPDLTLKDFLVEMKSIEPAARSFYSDVEMESEKFVRMLLIDSLYIVTTFCGMPKGQEKLNETNTRIVSNLDNEDRNEIDNQINQSVHWDDNESTQITGGGEINNMRLFSSLLEHDLFLLENQLPFFVLEKMYAFAYGGSETPLLDNMKYKVRHLLSAFTNLNSEMVISPTENVHHLLHVYHLFFRPLSQQQSSSYQIHESNEMFRLGSAMQLYEAGVTFEAKSGSREHCLLDIIFSRTGKLTMPCLHVDDNTDSLLRNLIALEQMKYPNMGLDVCAYAVLLLHLVTTPEDVELLRRKGIIEHHLASDKEMMYLINRLSVGLSFDYVEDRYSLKPLFHELMKYSERRVPRLKAWLKHRHFSNPWTMLALMVGFIFLLLSAVRTYYTVYSYYYPCLDCH